MTYEEETPSNLDQVAKCLSVATAEIENKNRTYTGLDDLDNAIGGFRPGQLIVIGSRPGVGKSALALNIAAHVASKNQSVVAFFSLEMTSTEIGRRLISLSSGLSLKSLDEGKLEAQDWAVVSETIEKLSGAQLYIDTTANLMAVDILRECETLRVNKGHIELVLVDYLQLVRGIINSREISRAHEIAEVMRDMKTIAKMLGCPVAVLSQINRNVESRSNKRPLISDLRCSESIEADADLILFLYRDELYFNETSDKGVAELIIAKNRMSVLGTVKVGFNSKEMRFENLKK